jgi:dihydroorotate dehydrogenase
MAARMPDWSYRTVLRPLLFRMPPEAARDLSVRLMGTLARSPLGPTVIDLMGHMRAPAALARTRMGVRFASPVGLGAGLDPEACAFAAFARFGVGFVEVGPVTLPPVTDAGPVERDDARQAIVFPEIPDNPGLLATARRLAATPVPGGVLTVRLAVARDADAPTAARECTQMIEPLTPHAEAFSVPVSAAWDDAALGAYLRELMAVVRGAHPARALLVSLPADVDATLADRVVAAARAEGVDGLAVDGSVAQGPGRRAIGRPAREAALGTVRHLRERGRTAVIVGAGGVHGPEDALALLAAGADLVQVESGLVFSGPGLPKRINDAVLYATTDVSRREAPPGAPPPQEQSWTWALLMGAGMLFGSLLAAVIAMTRVVLPYDEQFAGLTREQLMAANDRLLSFMTHDRVTLAGTMVSIGVLYTGFSWFGMRRGLHWAKISVLASAVVGFASFFLFLGFGYFDPFHAFVTAILFQFLVLAVHGRMAEPHGLAPPCLRDDAAWRRSQWGQLCLVLQGTALCVAGFAISGVGVTQVFVPEDLEFMRTTREALAGISRHLIPLVAHDRASFGGMLLASGVAFLTSALWGFRRGSRWLWWTWLLSALPAYVLAIGVHYAVGYHNTFHLAPAYAGLALFLTGMAASYSFLCARDHAHEQEWKKYRPAIR